MTAAKRNRQIEASERQRAELSPSHAMRRTGRAYRRMMNERKFKRLYLHSWSWNASTRSTLDEMLARLHHQINPLEDQPDLDKQMPENYDHLYELLCVAEQLLVYAKPTTPASQLLTFRILMDAPVDVDEAVTGDMLRLLNNPEGLESRYILRLYETCAFMLGRLKYYEDAHDVLKDMKACLKKHPSHYYMSWYHTIGGMGREKVVHLLPKWFSSVRAINQMTTSIWMIFLTMETGVLGVRIIS